VGITRAGRADLRARLRTQNESKSTMEDSYLLFTVSITPQRGCLGLAIEGGTKGIFVQSVEPFCVMYPPEKLQCGDRILAIAEHSILDWDHSRVVQLCRECLQKPLVPFRCMRYRARSYLLRDADPAQFPILCALQKRFRRRHRTRTSLFDFVAFCVHQTMISQSSHDDEEAS
jgi:hypothetical protein